MKVQFKTMMEIVMVVDNIKHIIFFIKLVIVYLVIRKTKKEIVLSALLQLYMMIKQILASAFLIIIN